MARTVSGRDAGRGEVAPPRGKPQRTTRDEG